MVGRFMFPELDNRGCVRGMYLFLGNTPQVFMTKGMI